MRILYIFMIIVTYAFRGVAQDISGQVNGHNYVDLGLPSKTLWATCNIGAEKPTDSGDYFAWGETRPKENYSWQTYKWCVFELDSITKYYIRDSLAQNERIGLGVLSLNDIIKKDSLKQKNKRFYDYMVLNTEDDAASCNWGKRWRMPTITEIKELIDACKWMFTPDFNGTNIKGFVGVSKANNNIIFLPTNGECNGTVIFRALPECTYWSSSLCDDRVSNSDFAYGLIFTENYIDWIPFSRETGLSVRAVVK